MRCQRCMTGIYIGYGEDVICISCGDTAPGLRVKDPIRGTQGHHDMIAKGGIDDSNWKRQKPGKIQLSLNL